MCRKCVSVSVEVSVYVVQMWWKCQCVSVSVEVSVFKGFSRRTLRNAFGKKTSPPFPCAAYSPISSAMKDLPQARLAHCCSPIPTE